MRSVRLMRLAEAEKYPRLTNLMDSWYVMDPMFHEMAKLVGKEQAIERPCAVQRDHDAVLRRIGRPYRNQPRARLQI